MRLKIIDTNFTTKYNWLFELSDENGNISYIMNEAFYLSRKLKNPITKKELDHFDNGQWINAIVEYIDSEAVIIKII